MFTSVEAESFSNIILVKTKLISNNPSWFFFHFDSYLETFKNYIPRFGLIKKIVQKDSARTESDTKIVPNQIEVRMLAHKSK